MRHLREDYDAIQPFPVKRPHHVRVDGELVMNCGEKVTDLGVLMEPIIPDDEPVFLVRGSDPCAFQAVLGWALEAERRGTDPDVVARVKQWASEMAYWAETHPPTKAPDVPTGLLRP